MKMGIYFRLNVLLISVAIQTLGEITFFPEIYTHFWKKSKIVISENQKIYSEPHLEVLAEVADSVNRGQEGPIF